MTWRVWTGDRRPTDEVYLAPRHMAGDWKISIHRSGYWQSGPTGRLRDKVSSDDRHAESRGSGSQGHLLAAIIVHREFLRPGTLRSDEVELPVQAEEDAWTVLIGDEDVDSPPSRHVGAIARRSLPSPHVSVCPITPIPGLATESLDVLADPGRTWSLPVEWSDTPFGFGQLHTDGGPLLFFEIAADADPPEHQRWFDTFPGDVRPIAEAPVKPPSAVDACAILQVRPNRSVVLFFEPHARCNHVRLVDYATAALRLFWEAGPEHWTPVDIQDPSAGWVTLIRKRAAGERSKGTVP